MKKSKVLLAFIHNDKMAVTMEDMGICFIASALRRNGYEVMLLSVNEKEIDYNEIAAFNPRVIGLTMYSMSRDSVYHTAEKLRSMFGDSILCVGGVYATYNNKKILLEQSCIDIAVRGEGEITFTELLDCIEEGGEFDAVKGISFRKDGNIIENENREAIQCFDDMPFPARDMLVRNKYKIALMSTSRGCCSNCSFCSSQLFWKKWRGKNAGRVVDEIEQIVQNYGIDIFNFIDSSFEDPYSDLRRPKAIAQEILGRGLCISYFADIRAEFHKKITPEIMELLKKSGLIAVCIGIEAGNEEDLKLYNKIAAVEDNCKVIEEMRKHGISISPGFINFNPYTTVKRIKANIEFLEKYGYAIRFFSFLDIYEGTMIYERIKNDGLLTEGTEGESQRFKYKFVEAEIEKLVNYLYSYKNSLNEKHNNAFGRMDFYSEIYPHLLGYYYRVLDFEKNAAAVELLNEHKEEYENIMAKFNKECSLWLKELIEIASMGWDEQEAGECTRKRLPEERMLEVLKRLDALKNRFNLNLARLGYGYLLTKV